MKYLYAPVAGFVILLGNLVAWLFVLIALPFAKWDSFPTKPLNHSPADDMMVMQGDMPGWAWWLQTPDQRLPGDLSIAEVKSLYDRRGRFICSWNWLGIRNPLMNLACWLGHPTTDFAPDNVMGLWTRGSDWRYTLKLGKVLLIVGYNVYKREDNSFVSAPVFTAKWASTLP